jgi:hypothetical protein
MISMLNSRLVSGQILENASICIISSWLVELLSFFKVHVYKFVVVSTINLLGHPDLSSAAFSVAIPHLSKKVFSPTFMASCPLDFHSSLPSLFCLQFIVKFVWCTSLDTFHLLDQYQWPWITSPSCPCPLALRSEHVWIRMDISSYVGWTMELWVVICILYFPLVCYLCNLSPKITIFHWCLLMSPVICGRCKERRVIQLIAIGFLQIEALIVTETMNSNLKIQNV